MGTWIEIKMDVDMQIEFDASFPSWERGLKSIFLLLCCIAWIVVPLVGTWIEMPQTVQ